MDEDLNENELEARLYAMVHYVDQTQNNIETSNQNDELKFLENIPRSTVRRYWRTNVEEQVTPYQKINNTKDSSDSNKKLESVEINKKILTPEVNKKTPAPVDNNKNPSNNLENAKPKEEKGSTPVATSVDLSILQSPVPQNIKNTVEIIDHDFHNHVVLDTSDEDEVVEVQLPPKPTITIEGSDEDELQIVITDSPKKKNRAKPLRCERETSASPVPSVVSSVSDEFIRSDCIALNISSRRPTNHSFDFSLHGSDLIDQGTPPKKKKKKKSKDTVTSTPIAAASNSAKITVADNCFATPKSKAKDRKQKSKSYSVSETSLPSADIYDSDSNQSINDLNKSKNSYVVTHKSVPSVDVYESDSSYSEIARKIIKSKPNNDVESSDSNNSVDKLNETSTIVKKNSSLIQTIQSDRSKTADHSKSSDRTVDTDSFVDLTETDNCIIESPSISENLVMGNVTGFIEPDDYGTKDTSVDILKFISSKVPAILNEDLDFDNLKGTENVCRRRRYSLTKLQVEMDKFYNESWGGENFNHREIQKHMSRDKSLWVIDAKDRMPSLSRRKILCNYCNRSGHRDDLCRFKPPVCYMCGSTGHFEPRCPKKICVNCGSPNQMYSAMCRNCCQWGRLTCGECGQRGHPASHCPDLWRRYHNTTDIDAPLERSTQMKKPHLLFCSGCSRRGHLVHACRATIPFSGLPINAPHVFSYRPVYAQTSEKRKSQEPPTSSASSKYKRQSKSPTAHETHPNKKRNVSVSEDDLRRNTKSPVNKRQDDMKSKKDVKNTSVDAPMEPDKAPDFIPLVSSNHDTKGHVIRDNEVSDTSDAITSARVYITASIIDRLKSKEGDEWLNDTLKKHNITLSNTEMNDFLSIQGKVGDQEAFQNDLRDWINKQNTDNIKTNNETHNYKENTIDNSLLTNIPKNKHTLLRQLKKSLDSLKQDLGDPKEIYKELTYFRNRHNKLLKQNVVSPKQLSNSRSHINDNLKRLNMLLIGQAGLDGSNHVNELYYFQEKVSNFTQNFIPPELRREIGEHYRSIFSSVPRCDYIDLLNKYYVSKQTTSTYDKPKEDFKVSPRFNKLKKKVNNYPSPHMHSNSNKSFAPNNLDNANGANSSNNLAFYHQRVMASRPTGKVLKKTRLDLARKIHSMITYMFTNVKRSAKMMKKIKKTQEQARLFLANV